MEKLNKVKCWCGGTRQEVWRGGDPRAGATTTPCSNPDCPVDSGQMTREDPDVVEARLKDAWYKQQARA